MKRVLVAALAVAAGVLLNGCTAAPDGPAITAGVHLQDEPAGGGVVYLIRGGANIFSTGMDEVAEKLRVQGIDAKSIPYADWRTVNANLRQRYSSEALPIVLGGHSFGADTALLMAYDLLKTNTPIALLLIFDVTETIKVPANVRQVVYFASSTVKGAPVDVIGGARFSGSIERIDVAEDHLIMDNSPRVQAAAIAAILKVIKPAAATASH